MPNAATVLVGLTRWQIKHDSDVREFVDAIPALMNPDIAPLLDNERKRSDIVAMHRFADDASAMFADYPFVDALKSNEAELSAARFTEVQQVAERLLDAAIELAGSVAAGTVAARGPSFVRQFPPLAVALRQLPFRFSLPWHGGPEGIDGLNAGGWGTWHPVIATFDDLLTWTTASLLRDGLARHIGRCEHCALHYFSRRADRHRFCPDTKCRDLFWSSRTGTERSRRSRAAGRKKK